MGVSKYIYTVYDAKTGEYVAKGTAAQLAGKGIFKDAGSGWRGWRSALSARSPAMPELLAAPPKQELCLGEPLSLRCRQLPDGE